MSVARNEISQVDEEKKPVSPPSVTTKKAKHAVSCCYYLSGNLNPHIPHVKGDPISGQFFKSCFEPGIAKLTQRCVQASKKDNGGVSQAFLFHKPYIFISHPSLLQQLIKFNGDKLLDAEAGGIQEKYFNDDTLVSLSKSDPRYSTKRGIIMAHLFNRVHTYVSPMQAILQPYIQMMAEGKELNLARISARISMTMISQLQLGFEIFPEEDKDYIASIVHTMIKRITSAPNIALLAMEEFLKNWMTQRVNLTPHLTQTLSQCEEVLKKLIKLNEKEVLKKMKALMGNNDLTASDLYKPSAMGMIKLFLVGGFETTSKLLLFSLLMLGDPKNASFIAKLRHEIAQQKKPPQEWTSEDLAKLEYLPAFAYEILRFFPPFSHQRLNATDDIWLAQDAPIFANKGEFNKFYANPSRDCDDDVLVPKGSVIVISPFDAHRNELIYKDAETFNPERWIGKNFSLRDIIMRSDFFTFGIDNRACPGRLFATQEALLLIATVAAKFDIETNLKSSIPLDVGFTLELAEGVVATGKFTPAKENVFEARLSI